MKTAIILIIALIIILGIAAGIYYFNKDKGDEIVACTEDARICPDETAVVRIPPDCDFKACPVSKICETNNDCVVFGEDGDCNCGCYNKQALPQDSGDACFCAAPTSCECVEKICEGIFGDVVGGDTDEHGCIGSAGYSWNETKQECVREWEEILKDACIELGCEEESIYAGSINSDKYYNCDCRWAKNLLPENVVCFATDEQALNAGRTKSEC